MEKRSLLDQLVNGFSGAVGDIREKLMAGWFGPDASPAPGGNGAINANAPNPGVSRTNIDLHIGDNYTIDSINVDSINVDMRQQNMTPSMRSWDDICAEVGPVRGSAPDKEHERGMDM